MGAYIWIVVRLNGFPAILIAAILSLTGENFAPFLELSWPSGYELQLSLERLWVLILVKVIGGQQEGHLVQKCSLLQQSPN